MALLLLSILGAGGAGVWCERRWGARAEDVTARGLTVALYTLFPFVSFCGVNRLELTAGVGAGLAAGAVGLLVAGAVAWGLTRLLDLEPTATGVVLCAAFVSNTGYLGLPLTAAVLGSDELGPAIAFDALVSTPAILLLGFGVGAALGTKAGETASERLRSFLVRNPPLAAVVLALVVPDSVVGDAVIDAGRAAALGLAPVGFFLLGIHLRHEAQDGTFRMPPPFTRVVGAALIVRLLVAPLVVVLVDLLIIGLPGPYLLQAAMPCGINCLVVAHLYGLDIKLAASAVASSTAIVLAVSGVAVIL